MNRWILLPALFIFALLPVSAYAAGGGAEGGLDLTSAIGVAIVVAGIAMTLFNLIRLPALLAYIVAGLVLSALASPWLADSVSTMESISHLGLVFLLFIIGLEMDLRGIMRLGTRTALAVILQAPIAFGVVLGFQHAAAALEIAIPGLGTGDSSFFYFAVACSLGSTAVVVKLLDDKFDLRSQAGKITILTLIAQDIWAVTALSYVASTSGGKGINLALMLGGGIGAVVLLVVIARFVLGRIMATLAKSPDLMALLAIGWCFLCVLAMSRVGLSAEMGALIAGLTLGAIPQHVEILAKVSALRDFFMALFFVALGMTLPSPTLDVMLDALALVGIAILVRMLLFAPALYASRLGPVVSLVAPMNLSQISEFTLLLVPLGIASGSLSVEQGAVISYGLMLSAVVTSFAIANNYRLARFLLRLLPDGGSTAEKTAEGASGGEMVARGEAGESNSHETQADIVLLGYFLDAEALAAELKRTSPDLVSRTLVVDFNLKNHRAIEAQGLRVSYGDISNPETLRHHGIADARVVLSTIGDTFLRGTSNQALARQVQSINPRARFIATADDDKAAAILLELGVYRVVIPPKQSAPLFAQALRDALAADSDSGVRPGQ